MYTIPYDEKNPLSIEEYSQQLIGKTFANVIAENTSHEIIIEDKGKYANSHENKNRKGGLGELIEECFFHYKCNNDSKPDFDQAGVELKVSPYKINKNGSLSAKERLIITMINYNEVINQEFYDSHLWSKSRLILLIYYLYEKEIKNRLDYKINYSKLFSPPEEDLKIIKSDYETILNKIKAGKAHELSEGDTLYLGASTKASSSADIRPQPYSNLSAKPRAFSFKASYMTHILNTYIIPNKTTYESIIKNKDELNDLSFKDYINFKINSYIGKSDKELCKMFNREYNNNKAQWTDLAFRMLGIKSNQAEEFIKANITVKTIRVEYSGKIVESMSLPSFKFKELIEQKWEESSLYNYFTDKIFLFVVFKKINNTYILKGSQLWNMPYEDLNLTVQEGWNSIRNTISNGVQFTIKESLKGFIVQNNFPKKQDNKIIHIRPHAQRSAFLFSDGQTFGNVKRDANELPNGQWMTTQSFWLNNSYILSILDITLL